MSKMLSGINFCFSISSRLILGWRLQMLYQIKGNNWLQSKCEPTSASAAFAARNEEWERDAWYCLFIWTCSATSNDKEDSGRKEKNKVSLWDRYLTVEIISKASLTLASHCALLKYPRLYEVSTFQLVSIIYRCRVSKGFNTSSNHRI